MTGHMLECHFPFDCRSAACQHLERYLEEPVTEAERFELEEIAEALARSWADPDCQQCSGSGRVQAQTRFQIPHRFIEQLHETLLADIPEDGVMHIQEPAVCVCVAEAVAKQR